jgi:hypothetical protein
MVDMVDDVDLVDDVDDIDNVFPAALEGIRLLFVIAPHNRPNAKYNSPDSRLLAPLFSRFRPILVAPLIHDDRRIAAHSGDQN